MTFATTIDLAAFLQEPVDAGSAQLHLDGAAATVQTLCGWPIAETTETFRLVAEQAHAYAPVHPILQYGMQAYRSVVSLRTLHLTAVAAVRVNGVAAASEAIAWTENGTLTLSFGSYPGDTVEIDATHGYNPIPSDLKLVVLGLAARSYFSPTSAKGEMIDRTKFGDVDRDLLPIEQRILDRYTIPRPTVRIRKSLLQDIAGVRTYQGESAYGPLYADSRSVRCAASATRRLALDSSGTEVVSEVSLVIHPDVVDEATGERVDPIATFAVGSHVTVQGRTSRVITAKSHNVRGRAVFIEVTLD